MGARAERCRSGGGMGRGKGWRLRHRNGGGPLAWRNAQGQGRHPATQRNCARRAGRPTRRMAGRMGSTAARQGACNRTVMWRQQPPTRRRNRSRRAGTITRGASERFDPLKSLRAVAARNSGRLGGAGGQAPSGLCDPCGRTVLLSHISVQHQCFPTGASRGFFLIPCEKIKYKPTPESLTSKLMFSACSEGSPFVCCKMPAKRGLYQFFPKIKIPSECP